MLGQLARESKRNPEEYEKFYSEFGSFIKEGAIMDTQNKAAIAKLLRFESSYVAPLEDADEAAEQSVGEDEEDKKPAAAAAAQATLEPTTVSLADVNGRCVEGQKNIFYLSAPSRAAAEESPYYEAFQAKGVEVIFVYNTGPQGDMDEYVMSNLGSFDGKVLVSCESDEATLALAELADVESKDEVDDARVSFCWHISSTQSVDTVAGASLGTTDHTIGSIALL